MNDGKFTVPLVADDGYTITDWARGDYLVEGAAHHKEARTDLRFLRHFNGAIVEITQSEKDAIIAADQQAAQQVIADAQAAAIAAANAPFVIDRMKLYNAIKELGRHTELRAFIAADEERSFIWYTARVLDSDNQMVVDAMPWFQSLLPEGATVQEFLRSCKVVQ